MVASAMEGWSHPISREALVLMDQYDLDLRVASGGKSKDRHPGRPKGMNGPAEGKRHGKPMPLSQARERLLERFGHAPPV